MYEWIRNRAVCLAAVAVAVAALALRGTLPAPALGGQPGPGGKVQGPDVIVGDIPDALSYGSVGGVSAFSVGTTSCNIGTQPLDWIANTPVHPVIAQNLYRIRDGRIEQIALSWLKHGFTSLNEDLCGTCQFPGGGGTQLGVNCSDPYSAGLNGAQGGLGPRSQVNPSSGAFPFPPRRLPANPGILAGRLQAANADLDPAKNPGAVYVVEAQYVHPQDAQNGNGNNNASHRLVTFPQQNGQFTLTLAPASPTVRMQPAIHAWKAKHPEVRLFEVDVPNDGRFILGILSTTRDKGFHHEVAVFNLNSDRAARALTVETGKEGNVSNPGFHGVKYHDELYADTDWVVGMNGPRIGWSTEKVAANPNANALRWGTMYSFWFDSDKPATKAVIELFKSGAVGAPTEMTIDLTAMPVGAPQPMPPGDPAHWAVEGAKGGRELGTDRKFRLDARGKVDRDLEPVESNLAGVKATATKMKDEATGRVFWEVVVEPPADFKGGYLEALLTFKTKTKGDPPLKLRVFGDIPAK